MTAQSPDRPLRWLLGSTYSYSPWNRAVEVAGLGAAGWFFASVFVEAWRYELNLIYADQGLTATAVALSALALAFLVADFVSGLVHCAADNFGTPSTPVIGAAFIIPFREHHKDPKDITRHDFIETNGNSAIVCLSVLVPTWWLLDGQASLTGLFAAAAVLGFVTFIMFTNQFHKWAHMDAPPGVVAALQRHRLILSPRHHEVHHTAPFDRHYCITTGWMNIPIERLGFFAWMVRTFKRP